MLFHESEVGVLNVAPVLQIRGPAMLLFLFVGIYEVRRWELPPME
jgi:hypothetical protein